MRQPFRYSYLASMVLIAIAPLAGMADTQALPAEPTSPQNRPVTFDPIFLSTSGFDNIDLTRFENGASVLPGTYTVEIYVNDEFVAFDQVVFTELKDKRVLPNLTLSTIKKINFNYSQLPASFRQGLETQKPYYLLSTLIPESMTNFDSGSQRLDISLPQLMMNNTARGYVSPELWDRGISAFLLGYDTNFYTTRSRHQTTNSAYAGIHAGLNIGQWFFRHEGNYNWHQNNGGQYQSISNYVERDLPPILGRLRLGETNTKGQVFDTLPFRGAELVSDERMRAPSLRGYAPDIRGVARTNARVTVRQNNQIIYETTVSPGAFKINDLYPTGYGGNLDVTITEANGSVQTFQVPYASLTNLLRPGTHNYDVVVGKLNDSSLSIKPLLAQFTFQRGLTNSVSAYVGGQLSKRYYALQLGSAFSTTIGAFSADITQSKIYLRHREKLETSGQSVQLKYSKFVPETNSNLSIAAYRYSTTGYYDFLTAMRVINAEREGGSSRNIWRPKNKINITMNQGLPSGWGQVFLTGYTQNYWNRSNSDIQYQFGYSNFYNSISYSLSAGRVRGARGNMETNWQFNLSMPLGRDESPHVPTLNASLNQSSKGQSGQQIGISGTAGQDYQYSYGVDALNYNHGGGSSVAFNGGYRSPYINMTGTYGKGRDYQNASAGLSGSVIAWPQGIVMTPYTGDTFAIVEAKGASGARVGGYSGVKVDPWGHAAIPYLNPYEFNEIEIDPKGMSYQTQLENTSDKVAPLAGAISKITFKTRQGYPLLINGRLSDGSVLPFGADVYDSQNNHLGSVGQMGQIYARVEKENDKLTVKWGQQQGQYCRLQYHIGIKPKKAKTDSISRTDAVCNKE